MSESRTLPELRLALVAARTRLRQAEISYDAARALAERGVVHAWGSEASLGSNAEARKRHLLLGIGEDEDFCREERDLEAARHAVEMVAALVANAEDERDERKRLTREKLADALVAFGAWSDGEAAVSAISATLDILARSHGLATPED